MNQNGLDYENVGELLEHKIQTVQERKSRKSYIKSLFLVVIIVYLLVGQIFGIALVKGRSMTPSLCSGDIVIYLRVLKNYQRGDVVIAQAPDGVEVIKRVVGTPKDEIEIKTGAVYLNGTKANEPYVYEETEEKTNVSYPVKLKENQFFLLGDHRTNSKDSRNYGPVEKNRIKGKKLFVLRMSN